MYAEGIIAGGLFVLCGIVCAVTCSPKASGISSTSTSMTQIRPRFDPDSTQVRQRPQNDLLLTFLGYKFELMPSYYNDFCNIGWLGIANTYCYCILCGRIQSSRNSWQTRKCFGILGRHRYYSYSLLIWQLDILGCAMAAVIEVLLGLSSCSACLTYADIVDRLEMRRQQVALAQKYPG